MTVMTAEPAASPQTRWTAIASPQRIGTAGLMATPANSQRLTGQTELRHSPPMMLRLRLLCSTWLVASLLLLVLCLGAQNLADRPSLRLGFGQSVPLPSGFLVGLALVVGMLSGGSAMALLGPAAAAAAARED